MHILYFIIFVMICTSKSIIQFLQILQTMKNAETILNAWKRNNVALEIIKYEKRV